MGEHLTIHELLEALKYCKGYVGGDTCIGCPNAIPGSENRDGFCKCRLNTYDEMIHVLETAIANNYSI